MAKGNVKRQQDEFNSLDFGSLDKIKIRAPLLCTNFYLTNKKYPLQIIVNCLSYTVHVIVIRTSV